MEKEEILHAGMLDIIFDGRNKQYGAYQLRSTYNRRLAIALTVVLGLCLLAVTGKVLANNNDGKKLQKPPMVEFYLDPVNEPPLPPSVPPPPPKQVLKLEVIQNLPPKIVQDEVPPPPAQKEMDDVAIGPVGQHGDKIDAVIPPPEPTGTGAKEIKTSEVSHNGPMIVQVQAAFPGGLDAWLKYLERNLRQDVPVDNGAPAGDYKVAVSFIVSEDGTVSGVQAENDPGYGIAAEAIRVILKSGKWTPAVQNGRYVTYRQQQPITFRVTDAN